MRLFMTLLKNSLFLTLLKYRCRQTDGRKTLILESPLRLKVPIVMNYYSIYLSKYFVQHPMKILISSSQLNQLCDPNQHPTHLTILIRHILLEQVFIFIKVNFI